jgi:hypothetical protein
VILALRIWRHYPYRESCDIFNNKSPKYFFTHESNLRQRQWLELTKDYQLPIHSNLDKANVISNDCSRNVPPTLDFLVADLF